MRATQAALSGEPVENYPAADDWSESDGRTREPEPTESLNAAAEWRRTATEVAPMLAGVELRPPEAPSGDSWLLPVAVDSARRAAEASLDDTPGQEDAPRALGEPEPDVPAPAPQDDTLAPVAATDNTSTTLPVDDWFGAEDVLAEREEPNQDAPELARRDEPIVEAEPMPEPAQAPEPAMPPAPIPEVTDSQKDKPAKTPVKLKSATEEAEKVPKVIPPQYGSQGSRR